MGRNVPTMDRPGVADGGLTFLTTVTAIRSDLVSAEAWRATFAEGIATLLFVFVGAGSVVATGELTNGGLNAARLVAIALAHGLAITLLVYSTANLSGGHINPVVTFAAAVTGKISVTKAAMYIAAQIGGAVIGALLLQSALPGALEGNLGAHGLGDDVSISMGIIMESVLTFALVFTIFATAIDPKGMGRLAPLAIGLAVLAGHLVAVSLTGASMNPARSFGPAVVASEWSDHWVYWVGPLIGGVLASVVYQVVFIRRAEVEQPRLRYEEGSATRPTRKIGGLKEVDIFRELSDEQIDQVAACGRRPHMSAGEVFGKEGQPGDALFIVLGGMARFSTDATAGGTPISTVRTVGPGESFPLTILVGSGAQITSLEAMTDLDLLVIPRSNLAALCSENPAIGMRLYAAMAAIIGTRFGNTLAHFTTRSERLRAELLHLESHSRWPF